MMIAIRWIAAGMLVLLAFTGTHSQNLNDEYFAGNWDVFIEGTPQGDHRLTLELTREEESLQGKFLTEDEPGSLNIDRIVENEDYVRLFFTAEGHYLNLQLRKQGEDHMTGSLAGMFNATADRITEEE